MKNSLKVAAWEIKRNLKNKTFLISMLVTPALMIVFGFLPNFILHLDENSKTTVHVYDELGLYEKILENISSESNLELVLQDTAVDNIEDTVRENPENYYMVLNENSVNQFGMIPVYSVKDGMPNFGELEAAINNAVRNFRLENFGLEESQIELVNERLIVSAINIDSTDDDFLSKAVPAAFAGIILLAVSITGIMTFQSSIGEKKDRMAEILLSSISCDNLMQGKILGYFALGILQAFVFIVFAIPISQYYFEIPVLTYLMNPVLILMVMFAMIGYFMFSALFVSFGATVEDIQEAGNFYSILFILPWLPLFVIGPVIASPGGAIATVASYIPLTAPGVMLFRLAFLSKIPVLDVIISLSILLVFSFFVMKLAGKIFKTGMLMTGKNASIKEIWKWVRR